MRRCWVNLLADSMSCTYHENGRTADSTRDCSHSVAESVVLAAWRSVLERHFAERGMYAMPRTLINLQWGYEQVCSPREHHSYASHHSPQFYRMCRGRMNTGSVFAGKPRRFEPYSVATLFSPIRRGLRRRGAGRQTPDNPSIDTSRLVGPCHLRTSLRNIVRTLHRTVGQTTHVPARHRCREHKPPPRVAHTPTQAVRASRRRPPTRTNAQRASREVTKAA